MFINIIMNHQERRRLKQFLFRASLFVLPLILSIAIATSPCKTGKLTGNICSECETGYTPVLVSQTEILCGKLTPAGDACYIDSADYATYNTTLAAGGITSFKYYPEEYGRPDLCFDCTWYYSRTTSASPSTKVQLCTSCDVNSVAANFYERSINSMTIGCTNCQSSAPFQYLQKLSLPNTFMRDCTSGASCLRTQYLSSKTRECQDCKDLFPNCAACTQTECLMCPRGFYLHKGIYDYQKGQHRDTCIYGVCPKGTCRNEDTNSCDQITVDATSGSLQQTCQVCTIVSGNQECELCRPGWYPRPADRQRCEEWQTVQDDLVYFVSNAPSMSSFNLASYTPTMGRSDMPYLFIQEVVNAVIDFQETNKKERVKAEIYLYKGDHFFFQCDGDETHSAQSDFSSLVKYCDQLGASMRKKYAINDRIQIYFRPMYCDLKDKLAQQNRAAFTSNCLQAGEKPRVFVNSANSYFNISGEFQFENIAFSGINSMAAPSKAGQDLTKFPATLCQAQTDPLGYDAPFKLTKNSASASLLSYTCNDRWYSAGKIVDLTKRTRRCQLNNNKKYSPNSESTLACPGDLNSKHFFKEVQGIYTSRRFTLFNMYAFPNHQSTLRIPPSLNLTNCDFEYFLGGYESLIQVETNNLKKLSRAYSWEFIDSSDGSDQTESESKTFYSFNQAEQGVRIRITASNFKNSRFCKGLIVYRKPLQILQTSVLTNFTQILSYTTNSDTLSYIVITRSTFSQLNIFTNVTALAALSNGASPNKTLDDGQQLETISYRAFIHKGIVLNLEDFGGSVEVTESSFLKNMHYLAEAASMPRKRGTLSSLEQFRDSSDEYKVTICDQDTREDANLFTHGISIAQIDPDTLFDKFERLSLIYISRNRNPMYFKDNRFWRNSGTFGGAITINSPNFRKTSYRPYLVVINCRFEQNQAYFGGNAIYMRNTKRKELSTDVCAGAYIKDSTFDQHVGLKTHSGGAIAGVCEYITNPQHDDYLATSSIVSIWIAVDLLQDLYEPLDSVLEGQQTLSVLSFRFAIDNCKFTENTSGMKGAAVYLKQMSKIKITKTIFQNNGPVSTLLEYQHSPQTLYLNNRPISYFDPTDTCLDEYSFLNDCQKSKDQTIDWPRVKGALHIEHCQESFCTDENDYQQVIINNCEFIANDVGPAMVPEFPSEDNALSLYINGGISNSIVNTKFRDHKGNFEYYTKNVAINYGRFFPSLYFQQAHAPIVRIRNYLPLYELYTPINFRTNFTKCTFNNNRHAQVLGMSKDKMFTGSLISFDTNFQSGSLLTPTLVVQSSIIRDNKFIGNETSLISVKEGQMIFTDNHIHGNGYLSNQFTKKARPAEIDFQAYIQYNSQQYGAVYISGSENLGAGISHQLARNNFSFIFSEEGAAFKLNLDSQFALITSNTYRNLYSLAGAALSLESQSASPTVVSLANETYDSLFSFRTGLLSVTAQSSSISLTLSNSTFRNCISQQGACLWMTGLNGFVLQNVTISDTAMFYASNRTALVVSQFSKQVWELVEFVESKLMQELSDQVAGRESLILIDQVKGNAAAISYPGINANRSQMSDCLIENVTAETVIIVKGMSQLLITSNSTRRSGFRNVTGGALRITENSIVNISNIAFNDSRNATRIVVDSGSSLNLNNTLFFQNRNDLETSACISISERSQLTCNQSIFRNNSAKSSSVLYSLNSRSLSFQSSVFHNNSQEDSLITLMSSPATLDSLTFLDNLGMTLSMTSSSVIATNLTVNNTLRSVSVIPDTGFCSMIQGSQLTLLASQFTNVRGTRAAVVSAQGGSSLTVDGSRFTGCVGQSVVDINMSPRETQITKSVIEGHSEAGIRVNRGQVRITDTRINGGSGVGIEANTANVTLTNVTIRDSNNPVSQGKGLFCNCQQLLIERSFFSNLGALEGGAIYLTSSNSQSNFTIRNSTFLNNFAMHGGAIKLQDGARVNLINNTFVNNSVYLFDPISLQSMKLTQRGRGGAINFDCNNIALRLSRNCDVTISGANLFINNTASHDGGALVYQSNPVRYDNTTVFQGNQARYGVNVASYPKEVKMQFVSSSDYLFNSTETKRNLQSQAFPTINSGTPFSFLIRILDQESQVFNADNTSKASFESDNPKVKIIGGLVGAVNGTYSFTNVTVLMEPGQSVNFKVGISGLESLGNPINFLSNPIQIQVSARKCAVGEQYTSDLRCEQCNQNNFLLVAPEKPTPCQQCPFEAKCFGRNITAPSSGFWRESNVSMTFLPCPNPSACLAGTPLIPAGSCAPGYTGIMCGNCISGYRRSGPFRCSQCPTLSQNWVYLLILLAITLLIVFIIVRAHLYFNDKHTSTYEVLLKLIVSHFHILGIIMSIEYSWPLELKRLQNGYAYFSGISQEIFSFDCFLQQMFGSASLDTQDDSSRIYSFKLIIFALAPIIVLVICGVFWFLLSLVRRDFSDFKIKTLSATLVIFFIIHPSIARIYFQAFSCIEVSGVKYLRDDISTKCFEGTHMLQVLLVALPSIIVWIFAVPVVLTVILYRNRERIRQIENSNQLSKLDQHQIKELRMKYGYLFSGYKKDMYYWEIVAIMTKVFLVMVTVYLKVVSSESQVLIGLFLLILFMILQVRFRPYVSQQVNNLQLSSIQVTSLTMYAGMFYVTGSHYTYMRGDGGLKWFFVFLIILPNSAFFLYWVNLLRIELLKLALFKSKRLFSIISCGLVDASDFEKRQSQIGDRDEVTDGEKKVYQPREQTYFVDQISGDGSKRSKIADGVDEFDDIRRKPSSSSDSDDRRGSVEPNYDTENGGQRVRPGVIRLDFPQSMMRKIGNPPETEHTNRRHTMQRLMDTDYASALDEQRTSREKQSTFRKVYPEQILTARDHNEGELDQPSQEEIRTSRIDRSDRSEFLFDSGLPSPSPTSKLISGGKTGPKTKKQAPPRQHTPTLTRSSRDSSDDDSQNPDINKRRGKSAKDHYPVKQDDSMSQDDKGKHARRESLSSLAQKEDDDPVEIDDIELSGDEFDSNRNDHFNQTFKAKGIPSSEESHENEATATKSKTRHQELLNQPDGTGSVPRRQRKRNFL